MIVIDMTSSIDHDVDSPVTGITFYSSTGSSVRFEKCTSAFFWYATVFNLADLKEDTHMSSIITVSKQL